MRLLLTGKDNPYTTKSGYGIAVYYWIQYFKERHTVACYAPVGTKYAIHRYQEDVPVYPGIKEDHGEDLIGDHYKHFNADALIQMADVWALQKIPGLARDGKLTGKFIWIIQPPIDFLDPIPSQILDILRCAYKVVPWVKDATVRLRKAGLENVADAIPLGLDTDIWHPFDRKQFPQTMKSLGFSEDTFNILIPAANQFLRKPWAETFEAIQRFKQNNPDIKVKVFAHSMQSLGDGWNLPELAKTFDLDVTGPEIYTMLIGGYEETDMVRIFNCADVVINAGFEGFGFATLQAQACGKPVIAMNAGPSPELVKDGILVPLRHPLMTPPNIRRGLPDADDIYKALQYIYNVGSDKFQAGPEWVEERFSWDVIMKKRWFPFLDQLEQDLEKDCLQGPPPIADTLQKATQEVVHFE